MSASANTSAKEFIRGQVNLKPHHHGSVVTIGSFDGVHLGHQAIIRQLKTQSHEFKLPAVAVIFEPQPREFFRAPAARIQPLREKVAALFDEGIDRVLCLRFDDALSKMAPEHFVQKILIEALGVQHLVVGDDFRFGKDRAGNDQLLTQMAGQEGFTIASAEVVEIDGKRVSSTYIRESLANGKFRRAAKFMGRPFAISGRVVHGRKLGAELGVPTANINLRRMLSPIHGSFAVIADIGDGREIKGVANVGVRPTVDGRDRALLEAHLFGLNENLYGKRINVTFKEKIREEKKFSSLDELKSQIHEDIATAKKILA